MTRNTSFILCIIFVYAFAFPAWAGPARDFKQGWQAFHALNKNPEKSRYRSYWMEVKNHFLKAYKTSPRGSYAPKSLYYLGRTYEELAKRSYLKSDFLQAIDYYQREINRFPDHSWTDDAQMHKALIYKEHLKDPAQAYIEFLKIVHNYPQGDMRPKAEKMLGEMDSKNAGKIKKEPQPNKNSKKEKTSKTASASKKEAASAKKRGASLKLQDIRHWSSDDYTRVVIDLEDETEYYHKMLKPDPDLGTPHRLFIDLSDTRLGAQATRKEKIEDGILEKIRAAQYRDDKARVVLDIQKLNKFRVFSLQNPFRIVVDVYAPESIKTRAKPSQKVTLSKDSKKFAENSLLEQLGLSVETIMLDPGHGGKDPGAVSAGIMEKDLNLKISRILGKILEKKGFRVIYTRTDDTFIPLEERTAMANSQKADLFISIHCNAHNSHRIRGFEVYYLNLAKSKDAVRVAARENSISEKKISDLQYILTDLMLNSKINESRDLAGSVHKSALKSGRQLYSGLNDHGVREAPFYVLMGAKMPAILVELGYITNSQDRARLTSKKFLTRMANGLVQGILDYKKEVEQYANLENK
ncbi:MAG: N-acetylmuramoyl-L-alanine amidase [Thermodesulfobacteriota bacterium]